MNPQDKIALVSMPGGGKSTIGRQLARRLDWEFIDIDSVIERRLGRTIRELFESHGEEHFRDVEQEAIAEQILRQKAVIATGGGAVLREANRISLRAHTITVYLRSTPEDLFRRLRHDVKRPLLQVPDPLRRLRELYAVRDPLYRETAQFSVDTGRPSVATLVNMILMQLELAGVLDAGATSSPIDGHPRPA